MASVPVNFIKASPTDQSVQFAGEHIDIKAMSEDLELNYTYLSHIFSATSDKVPSTKYGMKLASALGMDYPTFIEQLLEKKGI